MPATRPCRLAFFATLALGALAGPSKAFAAAQWDSETPYDYALLDRELPKMCEGINQNLGTTEKPVECAYDRASFDKHLAHELKIAKYSDRDPNDPYLYCVEGVFTSLYDTNSYPATNYIQNCKKARPEFQSKVKKIVCRYQEGQKESEMPKIELDKSGTLIVNVFHGNYTLHGNDWIVTGFRKLFPIYDACVKAHQ